MSSPLFAMQSLDKRFGQRVLFEDTRLELETGNGYVLTGPNGSGKTTLLRIVAGLEPADRGSLAFRAQPSALPGYPEAWRREIVYVHQQPYLFHTSIEKNIEYGLARRGMPPAERAARVREALAWAGLSAHRDVPPQKLSGGEKQRAALARAKVLSKNALSITIKHSDRGQKAAYQFASDHCASFGKLAVQSASGTGRGQDRPSSVIGNGRADTPP